MRLPYQQNHTRREETIDRHSTYCTFRVCKTQVCIMTKMHLKRKEREAKQQDGTASKIDLDWVVCHPIFLWTEERNSEKN